MLTIPDRTDAVVLDSGGVLMLPDPAKMGRVFERLGGRADVETCRMVHYASMREVDRLFVELEPGAPFDWAAVDREMARLAGVPEHRCADAVPGLEHVYLEAPWVPVPGAAEALVALQHAGFQLAVVSNATGSVQEQLAGHRICSVEGHEAAEVAVVVDSAVVGIEKPDARIFAFALDALGVDADRCIYIGDTVYFDVNGARAAGLWPVHLDPYGLCHQADHAHSRSLDDVVSALVDVTVRKVHP